MQDVLEVMESRMYAPAFTAAGRSKHSAHCAAAFGKLDARCHRCQELKQGAAPRKGWQPPWFAAKRREVQRGFSW